MHYSQALLARCQAYEAQALTARRDADGLQEISHLYGAITGEAVGTCRQCQYSDYRAAVTAYIREATRFFFPHLMADSKYTFAPAFANETISDGRYNKNVTAETLTDDDAKALLKLGYGHVIVEKGKADATTPAAGSSEASPEPSAAEKKATEAATKAQKETSDSKAALKAEKEAHKATAKELADTKRMLADSESKLTDVTNKLAEATQATESDAK